MRFINTIIVIIIIIIIIYEHSALPAHNFKLRQKSTDLTILTLTNYTHYNLLKGPGHHGDEEVDEDDDDGDVVEGGEEVPHALRHLTVFVLRRQMQGVVHWTTSVDPPEHRDEL